MRIQLIAALLLLTPMPVLAQADRVVPIEITLFQFVMGIIATGLITYFFSSRYHKKAARDLELAANELKIEAQEQRKLSDWILRLLEDGNKSLKVNRNEEGEPIGLNITVACNTEELGMTGHVGHVTVTTSDNSS